MHVPESPDGRDREPDGGGQIGALPGGGVRGEVEEVEIPGVVDGEQEAEHAAGVAAAAGDEVGEGGGVGGAAADVGGGRLGVEEGRRSAKAGDGGEEEEEGDERDGEEGEEPFLGPHAPGAWDDQQRG